MCKKTDCIFCKIAHHEIPAKIIDESEYAIAFLDLYPNSLGHALIIPKVHYDNWLTCDPIYLQGVTALAQSVAQKLLDVNLGIQGFNYLSNQGSVAGQVIGHFHLHVIPKYALGNGYESCSKPDVNHDAQTILNLENLIKKD